MTDLLIKGARIIVSDQKTDEVDIHLKDGKIAAIDSSLRSIKCTEINARGLTVMPGIIDAQVHFRDPGATHKEDLFSGSRAAIAGGITSFLEMPNTNPATISQKELNDKLKRAHEVSLANYGFFIGATGDNTKQINEATPACGIKIFMGSSTGTLLVDDPEKLDRIFSTGSRLIAVHAEDEKRLRKLKAELLPGREKEVGIHSKIRDAQCALMATQLAVSLAKKYQRRLHILHLTTSQEVSFLKDKPDYISAEVTPAHLFLSEEDYENQGSLVQMNPPIRSKANQRELWDGLLSGTIDFVATDHAPHLLYEKNKPYPESPSGMPQVEFMLPLMLTAAKSGKCSLEQVQNWLCHRPADAYGIIGKGYLKVGMDADITLVDLESKQSVKNRPIVSRCGWTPYAHFDLIGWPRYTIVGGQLVYTEDKYLRQRHHATFAQAGLSR